MRKQFATSIDTDILDEFKKSCDEYGLKMNTVLEALMQDFSSGSYSITVTKSGVSIKKEDWKEKSPFLDETGKFQVRRLDFTLSKFSLNHLLKNVNSDNKNFPKFFT